MSSSSSRRVPRLVEQDRRVDALLGHAAVEVDLAVAGALELLVDHLVHAAAGLDQRGADDRQRAAFLDVARRAEEALRALQRVGVDAAGQHLARRRQHVVVGARQAGDRVEQDHHVLLQLDQALGALDHHLGDLHVARGRLVEGRADDFAAHRALHLGHFLGPLVDQQHDQVDLGVVGDQRVRHVLHHHRLAALRRRDQQGALQEELEATQNEVKASMESNRDQDFVILVSLGGWIRGTQVVSGSILENYNEASARVLRQPALIGYIQAKMNDISPELQQEPLVKAVREKLSEIQKLVTFSRSGTPTAEEVRRLNDAVSSLMADIQNKSETK